MWVQVPPVLPFMEKGDKFIYTDQLGKTQVVTYTGTRREIKGCLFDFFTMADGSCAFFYLSEVCSPTFIPFDMLSWVE